MRKLNERFNIKISLLALTLIAGISSISAQETDTGKGEGVKAAIDLYVDIFRVTNQTFERPDIRGKTYQDNTVAEFFYTNKDFWSDSKVSIGYDGSFFGGSFAIQPGEELIKPVSKLKGWVQFGFLRVTLGNDIESVYADPLDADPKIRIYTGKNSNGVVSWNSTINPDNITRDEGLLVEAFLKSFTIAAAAGNFTSKFDPLKVATANEYIDRYEGTFRYGARVGYNLGQFGKVNASYTMDYESVANNYSFKSANSTDIVPIKPDAEVFKHIFGVYGSLHLTPVLDLTVGYNGFITAYLSEFYLAGNPVQTGYPIVFKNGVNLNLRYKGIAGLTLRTDHCLTLWEDKDYELFETTGNSAWINIGLTPSVNADNYASISHLILWNGIGAAYEFTDRFTGSIYVRNLFSQYTASGRTPNGSGNYTLFRDQIGVEIKGMYKLHPKAEVFVKLILEDTMISRSQDLNAQSPNHFIQNPAPEPVETFDNELLVRIPIGIQLTLQ
ncbi:MAG: hypothetical protein LBG73_10715 [Spirochaetaceae bacterium]|jgi:hypothetical protein|nr:hypothetical protein [Spirochaetaceae bacterium]